MSTILPDDRGRRGAHYTLLTPANRYVSRMPGGLDVQHFKLVTPRLFPARFEQSLVMAGAEPISADIPPGHERFLFVLDGAVSVHLGGEHIDLPKGGFIYLGPAQFFAIELAAGASCLAIKRPYDPWRDVAEPAPVWGGLEDAERTPTIVPGLHRRELLNPTDAAFDFNITHMEFDPGVALHQIEIHDEEHGLYMTGGGGLYHLDGDEHEVFAHDFIYMAPYCPQGFRAGSEGGSYLLYKDVYRDTF